MTYGINAVTSLRELYITADTLAGGWYISLGLFAVFLVAFISIYMRGNPAPQSAAAGGFIATLAAILLWVAGVVGTQIVGVMFALMLAGVLWTYLT